MKGPHFFEKRRKEMAKAEKAKQKADRKAQRKAGIKDPEDESESSEDGGEGEGSNEFAGLEDTQPTSGGSEAAPKAGEEGSTNGQP